MKVIVDYCTQKRKYGDSYGECVVQLEEGETIDDVKAKYIDVKREWYEQKYSNAIEIEEYHTKRYIDGKYVDVVYVGRLVKMNTHQAYLD